MTKGLKGILYGAAALFSFILFFIFLFPYDQLSSRLVGEVEKSLGGRMHLKIGHMSARPIAHLTVRNVELVKGEGEGAPLVRIDKIGIGVSLFSTLFGSPKFGFRIRQGDGDVDGDFKSGSEAVTVEADIEDWNIGSMEFIKQDLGLDLASRLDGEVGLELYKTDPIRHQGTVILDLKELKVLPSKLKLGEAGEGLEMDLPALELARKHDSGMDFQIGKGRVEIKKINMTGEDLKLTAEGQLFLARDAADWRLNIKGKFKPSEKLAGAVAVFFIVDKQKDAEGFYPFSITGRLAKPNIRIGTFRVPL